MAVNHKKNFTVGVGFGLSAWVLGWLYGLIFSAGSGQVQATLNLAPIADSVKQQIQAGISTDLASMIIGWVNGVLPISLWGLVVLGFAGGLIGLAGGYLVSLVPAKWVSTPMKRLIGIAVLGSFAIGLILSWLSGNPSLPALSTAISMVIYFTIVAVVYGFVAKFAKGTALSKLFIEA